MAARHKEGRIQLKIKYPRIYFLECKGLSIDDVGVSRDTVFQEIRPGADFETGDFVQERLGELPKKDSRVLNNSNMFDLIGLPRMESTFEVKLLIMCKKL